MSKPINVGLLRRYVHNARAADVLQTYFSSGAFTGGWFERFAGGGDRPEVADRFTSDDIVAVAMLAVRIPGRSALALIEDAAAESGRLLGTIPTDVALHEAGAAELIAPSSAAAQLWQVLVGIPGVSWVTASKLLARKRPALLPVYDRVVRAALGRTASEDLWEPLHATLATNPDLIVDLHDARSRAGIGDDITPLRVLDVIIWMLEHGEPEPLPDAES